MRPLIGLLVACLLLGAAGRGMAQSPTRGVRLPFPAVSLGDEASGFEFNPGSLGLLRGIESQVVITDLQDGVGGSGQAFFVSSPIIWGISLGLGIQHLGSQNLGARIFQDYTRISFGAAFAPTDVFSVGLAVNRNFGELIGVSGLTSLDLGLVWRPLRWLSIGAAVQDLTTPRLLGTSVNRSWYLGLGFRPATERVFLGFDLRIEEIARTVDPTFRLAFEPVRGLQIGSSLQIRDRDGTTEVAAQIGLTWNFDLLGSWLRGGVGYSSYLQRGQPGGAHDGFTFAARFRRAREPSLPEPRARFVKVHLKGGIPEHAGPVGLFSGRTPRWTTRRALALLGAALRDERVGGVLVAFDGVGMGFAQAEEIHAALRRLRKAGKRVIAYLNGASNATYFAACAAERVYLHPLTTFNAVGFASSVLFLRGLADKVGILPEFIAEGKYKSAPEMFTRRGMSAPAREARLAFLRDAFASMVRAIAAQRRKPVSEVRALIDRAPLAPEETVRAGLADGTAYLDEIPKRLAKEGLHISYLPDPGAPAYSRWGGYPGLAVIHLEGVIAEGKSYFDPIFRRRIAGAETIVRAIRQAAGDWRIRAIVLRINSPGGSASAGDRIWRAVIQARKRKPVVASFGNVAASAGYEAGVGATEIFADPSSLTGSIGVFFGKASAQGLFHKLAVNQETVKVGKRADLLSYGRPWTPAERKLMRRLVKHYYRQFVQRVAQGRRLKRAKVHAVAQGRIWSGRAALRHRLVDRLGGLDQAIARAKELAGMPRTALARIVELPQASFFSRLLRRFRVEGELAAGLRAVTPALRAVASPLLYLRPGEALALLPFELTLR